MCRPISHELGLRLRLGVTVRVEFVTLIYTFTDIYFCQRPLALKVMCQCLKQPRFVVVEAATSFPDVHAVFQRVPRALSSHKNKIQKKIPPIPVPNFYQTTTGITGFFTPNPSIAQAYRRRSYEPTFSRGAEPYLP